MSSLPPCPNGPDCAFLEDEEHIGLFCHPSIPNIPPTATLELEDCPYGTRCQFLGDSEHCLLYRHLQSADLQALEKCPYGPSCKLRSSPDHEARYDHSSAPEIEPDSVSSAAAAAAASSTPSIEPTPPVVSALPACPNRDLCYLRDRQHAATHSHPTGWTPESGFEKASLAASQANETARLQSIAVSGRDSRPRCSFDSTCYRTNVLHATQEAHLEGWKPARRVAGRAGRSALRGAGRSTRRVAGAGRSTRGRTGGVPSAGRRACKYGMGCWQTNSPHVQGFQHPDGWFPGLVPKPGGQTAPRVPHQQPRGGSTPAGSTGRACPYGIGCYQMGRQHARDFVHPQGWDPKASGRGRGGY